MSPTGSLLEFLFPCLSSVLILQVDLTFKYISIQEEKQKNSVDALLCKTDQPALTSALNKLSLACVLLCQNQLTACSYQITHRARQKSSSTARKKEVQTILLYTVTSQKILPTLVATQNANHRMHRWIVNISKSRLLN